jgi:hypothetical protein
LSIAFQRRSAKIVGSVLIVNKFTKYAKLLYQAIKELNMKCDICKSRMELEDAIPVSATPFSTAQRLFGDTFDYIALSCEDCVEDYFQLELV